MKSFWQAWFDAGKFAIDTQTVMALRMARLATGKKGTDIELRRMFSEKMSAFSEAQMAMAFAMLRGASPNVMMARVHSPYRRRVHANRRRLSSLKD
jgi:hypothetical protein